MLLVIASLVKAIVPREIVNPMPAPEDMLVLPEIVQPTIDELADWLPLTPEMPIPPPNPPEFDSIRLSVIVATTFSKNVPPPTL